MVNAFGTPFKGVSMSTHSRWALIHIDRRPSTVCGPSLKVRGGAEIEVKYCLFGSAFGRKNALMAKQYKNPDEYTEFYRT
jgi:hypothetical protein